MLILAAYIPTLTHRELRGFVKGAVVAAACKLYQSGQIE